MRFTSLALMAALFAGLSTSRCPAQSQTAGRSADNWTVEREQALFVPVNEPLLHFKDARKLFLQENPRKAAREIRKAAAFMSLHAELATVKGKRALIASIRELDHLGNQLERGNFDKARSSAETARARSMQYEQKIHRVIEQAKCDSRQVDWRNEVHETLLDANEHVDVRLRIEDDIIRSARDKLDAIADEDENRHSLSEVARHGITVAGRQSARSSSGREANAGR